MEKVKNAISKIKNNIIEHKKVLVIITSIICVLLVGVMVYNFLLLPRIELNGSKKIVLEYQDDYVEDGYKANYFNEDLTDDVKVKGKVDSNKLGTYEVTYEVKKGLFKRKVVRTVVVEDSTAPVLNVSEEEKYILCPGSEFNGGNYSASDNHDGDITSEVDIEVLEDKVIYKVSDKSGNTTKIEKELVYSDETAPVLALNGNDIVYAFVGDEYSEKGYSAADNCDGNISDNVSVSGNVDTSQSGEFVLTYEVSDKSGNVSSKTRKVIVTERGKNGVIYLTFDDGPRSGTTDVILDILKEEGVSATFFVTNGGPDDLIKRIYEEGHTIALHTASHDYSVVYASVDNYFSDLYSVSDRVKRITGVESKIIRFPGGTSNTVSRKYCSGIMTTLTKEVLNRGFKYYDWNVSSGDASGSGVSSDDVYNNVVNGLKKNRSNIVLMHDTKGITRDALKNIIKYGKDNGYSFEKITLDTEMITQRVNN